MYLYLRSIQFYYIILEWVDPVRIICIGIICVYGIQSIIKILYIGWFVVPYLVCTYYRPLDDVYNRRTHVRMYAFTKDKKSNTT